MNSPLVCRFCSAPLTTVVVDLGSSPLCESYLTAEDLHRMEPFYPLCAYLCDRCSLVQLEEFVSGEEIFSDYAYFSSYSDSWLGHVRRYVAMATERFGLGPSSHVVEVASNDGYLLQYFVKRDIPCLGIEPAANVAEAAVQRGVRTLVEYLGHASAERIAARHPPADLLIANNVFAHVPGLNDFTAGLARLLGREGVLTLEFPHLVRLIDGNQFDTIYHEHFCYFALTTAQRVLAAHGLRVFDVEELSTHGGSLRVYAAHEASSHPPTEAVAGLLERERRLGVETLGYYASFAERVSETKRKLLELLITLRRDGRSVVGYGAPGKANTLLNYCGVRSDFLEFTVDRSPHKQGKYLPGSRIPIHPPERIRERQPDYILVLPWNLKDEIMEQLSYAREWGCRFVVPIPRPTVYS